MRMVMLLTLLFITACASPNDRDKPASEGQETNVIGENLKIPWEIVKSGETFYMTEREGTIATYEDGAIEREKVVLEKPLLTKGEGGLLGLELYPDFSDSRKAFMYHTYEENGETFNRVIEATRTENGWKETDEIISSIPGSLYHNGGRVKIGPDKKLYITTGDATDPDLAQDKSSLAGKILRLNQDGSIPDDNPIDNSYVYSYGHRNPQGIAWDKEGQLYSSEHGDSAHDEINKIIGGENYGWPIIEGDQEKKGMVPPIYHSSNDTWAPSGIVIKGQTLYAATLRGNEVRSFSLDEMNSESLLSGFGRLRALYFQDEAFYVITNNTDGRGDASEEDDRFIEFQLN
ncbi:PQQ-dependent sugar dehydrogenase [Guptibacillus algicola]|uniref:PQQ-dependent sugar dehydrogenase n=1 Tax=Guptibacillus algicola TaxID=225844 RepID=UPI001CD1C8EA|nr:PQQ-dependent sugar dehydrogenase [Alkalihalobacillus algicola]MCA0985665.1 PQQ-dependent sugar dehydrogenase [Alkalihalobacillus algicola]